MRLVRSLLSGQLVICGLFSYYFIFEIESA
jgi:hypothetical protein